MEKNAGNSSQQDSNAGKAAKAALREDKHLNKAYPLSDVESKQDQIINPEKEIEDGKKP